MIMWGLFSHNVLEERYILLAAALLASMVIAANRRRTVPDRATGPRPRSNRRVRWP